MVSTNDLRLPRCDRFYLDGLVGSQRFAAFCRGSRFDTVTLHPWVSRALGREARKMRIVFFPCGNACCFVWMLRRICEYLGGGRDLVECPQVSLPLISLAPAGSGVSICAFWDAARSMSSDFVPKKNTPHLCDDTQ